MRNTPKKTAGRPVLTDEEIVERVLAAQKAGGARTHTTKTWAVIGPTGKVTTRRGKVCVYASIYKAINRARGAEWVVPCTISHKVVARRRGAA